MVDEGTCENFCSESHLCAFLVSVKINYKGKGGPFDRHYVPITKMSCKKIRPLRSIDGWCVRERRVPASPERGRGVSGQRSSNPH